MFDLLIKDGVVVDGTGRAPIGADVGVKDGVVEDIGSFPGAVAEKVVDAAKMIVSPGFVDTHSHSDLVIFSDPFVVPKVMQGVTTEVISQDGMGLAPLRDEFIEVWKKSMSSLAGPGQIDWPWRTVGEFLAAIEEVDLGPNVAVLTPHSNLRMVAMGLDDREPSREEMGRMRSMLQESLDEGSFGMSTGMIYPPCCFGKTPEFVELGKVLAKNDAIFVTHQRSEADAVLESADEIFTIGQESGCNIHFSHLKVCGKKNWDKLPLLFDKFDRAKRRGTRVSFDQYPYVAGSTMLSVILPPWAHDGGAGKMLGRLRDREERDRMIADIENGIPGWDNFVDFAGLEGIYVASVSTPQNKDLVGKNFLEIGAARGKRPLDAVMDLILQEENGATLVDFYGTEEHVAAIMRRPEHNVASDGVMGDRPHPRLYGTFPRVLGKYVRDEKVLSLQEAVHKMTGKASEALGLSGRGFLKKGYAADIVVFDPDTVADTATYAEPKQYPSGIRWVIVNGKILVEDGQMRPKKAGRVLRARGGR